MKCSEQGLSLKEYKTIVKQINLFKNEYEEKIKTYMSGLFIFHYLFVFSFLFEVFFKKINFFLQNSLIFTHFRTFQQNYLIFTSIHF